MLVNCLALQALLCFVCAFSSGRMSFEGMQNIVDRTSWQTRSIIARLLKCSTRTLGQTRPPRTPSPSAPCRTFQGHLIRHDDAVVRSAKWKLHCTIADCKIQVSLGSFFLSFCLSVTLTAPFARGTSRMFRCKRLEAVATPHHTTAHHSTAQHSTAHHTCKA